MTIDDFCEHHLSRAARLGKAHVLALRLYTTAAFKSIVNPMRCVDLSHSWSESPHALPVTVYFLTEAISRLRSVERQVSGPLDLWRGLANMSRALPADFERLGGTEKAPMSTTTSLDVAVRYSASRTPLLLRLRTPNFMQRGASIAFLSAFPVEEIPYLLSILAEGLAKRSPSSMLCNTTSSLIVRGAESAVHCGEAAQRGLAPCTALSGAGEGGRWRRRRGARRWRRWCGRRDDRGGGGIDRGGGGHERSGARRGGGRRRGAGERGARAIRGTRRCEMEGGGDGGEARGGGGGGGGENGGTPSLSR